MNARQLENDSLSVVNKVKVKPFAGFPFRKEVEGVIDLNKSPRNDGKVPVYIAAGRNSGTYWCDSSSVIPIKTHLKPLDWVTNKLQVGVVESVEGMDVWVEWMDGSESGCALKCHSNSLELLDQNWDLGYRRGSQALLNDRVATVVGYIWQDAPQPIVEIDGVQSRADFSQLQPLSSKTTSLPKAAAVEVLEALSYDEERSRQQLERKIERAFYEAGSALRELRDRRLYRSTHKTFEAYCRDRFEFSRQAANYAIGATEVFENLTTICCQILPTKASQLRPIVSASLKPEEQCRVWLQSVEEFGGKVPPARIVKGIVQRIKAKPPTSAKDFCSPGDVFILQGLQDSEKRYNGCWCIAVQLNHFSIMVDTVFGSSQVKPENLDRIDYPGVKEKMQDTLARIHALGDRIKEEPSAVAILNSLAKRTDLTPFDEGLLNYMEQHCSSSNL